MQDILYPVSAHLYSSPPARTHPPIVVMGLPQAYQFTGELSAANKKLSHGGAQVATLATEVQAVCGDAVQLAFVDQGYTGEDAARTGQAAGIRLEVVKHTQAKRGFVLLPRRWVVERTFGWLGRFRRLARDYERLTVTLQGWHWLAALALFLRTQFGSA